MFWIQEPLWQWEHDEPHFRDKPDEWGCVCECLCPNCVNSWWVCICDECPADSRTIGSDEWT